MTYEVVIEDIVGNKYYTNKLQKYSCDGIDEVHGDIFEYENNEFYCEFINPCSECIAVVKITIYDDYDMKYYNEFTQPIELYRNNERVFVLNMINKLLFRR